MASVAGLNFEGSGGLKFLRMSLLLIAASVLYV